MSEDYTLAELSLEEQQAVQKDINAVLEKYDCEIQIASQIHILKRQSTLKVDESDSTREEAKPNSEAEEGG